MENNEGTVSDTEKTRLFLHHGFNNWFPKFKQPTSEEQLCPRIKWRSKRIPADLPKYLLIPSHFRLFHLPLILLFFHFTSRFWSTVPSFLPLYPDYILTMWIPALLLWILNISRLCSGQDFIDFYHAGDMVTEVRYSFSEYLEFWRYNKYMKMGTFHHQSSWTWINMQGGKYWSLWNTFVYMWWSS